MDLSEVPLLVLEKVRNKWWDITKPDDRRIHRLCAMCRYMEEVCPDENACAEFCPIRTGCRDVVGTNSPYWKERRDAFLAHIIAEIDRRSTCK